MDYYKDQVQRTLKANLPYETLCSETVTILVSFVKGEYFIVSNNTTIICKNHFMLVLTWLLTFNIPNSCLRQRDERQ